MAVGDIDSAPIAPEKHHPGHPAGDDEERDDRQMRWGLAVLLLVLCSSMCGGCDSSDSRTTATVQSVGEGRACLQPEDLDQTDLAGCFPVTDEDAGRLEAGDCIEVLIPNQLDGANASRPLHGVKVLERDCRSHR